MWTMLIVTAAVGLAWPKGGESLMSLAGLLGQVRSIEGALRSGTFDWRPAEAAMPEPCAAVLTAAWEQGRPLLAGLAAFREQLLRARASAVANLSLRRLFWGRSAFGLALALALRLLLAEAPLAASPRDVVAGVLAVAPFALGQVWLSRTVPRSWMLNASGLSNAACFWLQAYLGEDIPADFPLSTQLNLINDREFSQGVSLGEEKHQLLADWSASCLGQAEQQRQRLEDFLPILELFAIGLPITVLLAEPIHRFLHSFL